jgi:ParB family chromosome partitioning protein
MSRKKIEVPQMRTVGEFLSSPTKSSQSSLVDKIHLPTKNQPRRYFALDKMAQLVASVKEHGILEPLLVRPLHNGEYELIAGERRLRAAKEVGLKEVPIVVKELDDKQAFQVSLMENLQREDLNPVEETEAVLELLALNLALDKHEVVSILHQSYNAKQRGQQLNQIVLIQLEQIESILTEVGRFNAGTFRSSRLPLLNLPDDLLSALRCGEIEYTKAIALARVKNEQQRDDLLKLAIANNLSLSEIKGKIKDIKLDEETTPERKIVQRFTDIGKRLRQAKAWSNQKKQERISKLLDELEKLTSND